VTFVIQKTYGYSRVDTTNAMIAGMYSTILKPPEEDDEKSSHNN
jgi:hypothetical protein